MSVVLLLGGKEEEVIIGKDKISTLIILGIPKMCIYSNMPVGASLGLLGETSKQGQQTLMQSLTLFTGYLFSQILTESSPVISF